MEQKNFDIIVIGGGPGGYPAAIRAAQLGKKVALIEAKELGGTCLNRGCIPSKALIAGAELWNRIQEAHEFGITVKDASFDYGKMVDRKDKVVANVRRGLEGLIKANKITLVKGFAQFKSPSEVEVNGDVLKGDRIIIATGSEPRPIPQFPFDYKKIHDSTSLLELKTLPKSIAIIGGGVIGCEFASLFNAFGTEVAIFEMLPSILPAEAKIVSSTLAKIFKGKGIKIEANAAVENVRATEKGVEVKSGTAVYEAEAALIAVGRTMNTSKLNLEKAGVKTDGKGNIPVNDKMETNVPHIYAIGDIASKWWLAHVATHQGLVAGNNAAGKNAHMHYDSIPNVIFTQPEIGTVGLSLEAALEKGYDAKVGAFPFQALGKAQAALQTEGFAQIIIDKKTGQILGAQIIGHEASSLIAEMGVAIANELTVECITETIHAHPTVAEVWMEAALVAFETPVHMPPKP